MASPEILRTDRLVLTRWTAEYADFLFDMYSRWEVQQYMGRVPAVMTDPGAIPDLLTRWESLRDGARGVWAIFKDEPSATPVGSILLKSIPASGTGEPSGDIEIGWHLHPDQWGHGYATEAASAVLAAGFSSGLDRVVAVTRTANTASQAVCARLGMTHLGLSDEYYDVTCELFEKLRPQE